MICAVFLLGSLLKVYQAITTGVIDVRRGEIAFYDDPGTFSAFFLLWLGVAVAMTWFLGWRLWRSLRSAP